MDHFSPTQPEDNIVTQSPAVHAEALTNADMPPNETQTKYDSKPVIPTTSAKARSPVFLDFSFPTEQLTKYRLVRYCTPEKFFVTEVNKIATLAENIRTEMEKKQNINIPVKTDNLVVGSCWAYNSPDRGWVRVKLMNNAQHHSPTDVVRARLIDLRNWLRISYR